MNQRILIPSFISSIRIVLAPLLFLSFYNDMKVLSFILFISAVLTDALDGYLARKLDVTSNFGAYLDTAADFILILTAFSAFVITGLYPYWIMILIIFMFLQFILTSGIKTPVYDPFGKYYGSFLFLSLRNTLIFSNNININFFLGLIGIFSVISLITRFLFITQQKKLFN